MTAQTSYTIYQAKAYAGQLVDLGPSVRISRSAEGDIDFGVVVGRGTDSVNQCVPGNGGALIDILGITYRSLEREGAANTGAIKYAEKETVGILQQGYIYAVCPSGCAAGATVKFNNTTGVLDAGGAVAGETVLDDAQWDSTTPAGEIGIIRLLGLSATAGV